MWTFVPDGELFSAVAADDLSLVKRLVKAGANVNQVNLNPITDLLPFIRSKEILDFLIGSGLVINYESYLNCISCVGKIAPDGFPSGELMLIQWLIDRGQSTNGKFRNRAESFRKDTPLTQAVRSRQVGVVQILLSNGSNVHEPVEPDLWQPIHYAVYDLAIETTVSVIQSTHVIEKLMAIIDLLLAHKANINARNLAGEIPLMWAVFRGSRVAVEFLMDRGGDLFISDRSGRDSIGWAAKSQRGKSGRIKLEKYLIAMKERYYKIDQETGEIVRSSGCHV